ncbi:PadR family transcriptional regulator [Fictibacillus fluitans]|uniref:PadR family transcriptional regulator n=1 Tax=Fictibacillus fluitans TaxID=3058422 RepID=A0ABT8I3M5_9BACL|nr:PadR family transcriptional regulator [Fictibacillus sp. NE201]MDN4527300.1 PadR family transcriptional regulator [Fictibacillus sp. NE201]
MALKYALLGLLTKNEATGYELNQQFKETMIHFWSAHHTQIYRQLVKMEEEGLVSSQVVHQVDYPDKKVYRLEDKGYEMLLQWLFSKEILPSTLKDDLLLRVSLFQLIPADEAIAFLERAKEQHMFGLGLMEKWRDSHFPEGEFNQEDLGEYLTSEFGQRYMQHWIEWCDWAIQVIKRTKEKGSDVK